MATQSYLIDQITNRSIDVIRVANNTAASNSIGLFSLYRDIMRQLEKTPSSKWYQLAKDVEALLQNEMRGVVKEVKADLAEFAAIESKFAVNLLATATVVSFDELKTPSELILATFTKEPINHFVEGKKITTPTVDSLLRKLTTKNPRLVRNIIRDAALTGKTAKQISGDIRKIAVNASKRDIEATTLTSFNHFSNQAKQAVYSANDDILEGVQLLAVLDSKTTEVCMGYDHTVWPVNSGPRPPFHYRCRTQAIPIVKEKYRIPIRSDTRASETGPVDASLTYDGFLRRMGKERQNDILGPNRAKLFRKGLPVGKFTDNGVKLTLKQLRRRYPDKF